MPKIIRIEEVKSGPSKVNEMLLQGWEILHVIPNSYCVTYVMGMREKIGVGDSEEKPKRIK